MDVELAVEDDAAGASRRASEEIAKAARAGGHVVLSGGSTGPTYEAAARLEPDWGGVTLWWADERCVPPDDERSNYGLVRDSLLDRLERPPREVRRVHGELPPEEAARLYDEALADVTLDFALLGVGPDGHTASLFPHAPALEERERRSVAVEAGLEPFVPRVTMTIPMLASARLAVYLVTGAAKADAVARAFARTPDPCTPASLVRGRRTIAVVDAAAAALLSL